MKHKTQEKCPFIGISANLITIETGSFIGRERAAVGDDYIQSVQQVGGVPLVLPMIKEQRLIEQQVEVIDGLLLSGGGDVSPLLYGEEPKRELGAICTDRDAYELELVHIAHRLGKPIFGICRGLQMLNVALGGSLYQDIAAALSTSFQHQSKAKPDEAIHTVAILPHTRLQSILNENMIITNSFHHQAIKDLAPGLIVNARTQDGLIEGIEGANDLFILGVQWHPELMIQKHSKMLKLFHAFVEAARKRRAT